MYIKGNLFVQEKYKIRITNIDIDQEKVVKIIVIKPFKPKKRDCRQSIRSSLKQITREEALKWQGSNFWEGDLEQMRSI